MNDDEGDAEDEDNEEAEGTEEAEGRESEENDEEPELEEQEEQEEQEELEDQEEPDEAVAEDDSEASDSDYTPTNDTSTRAVWTRLKRRKTNHPVSPSSPPTHLSSSSSNNSSLPHAHTTRGQGESPAREHTPGERGEEGIDSPGDSDETATDTTASSSASSSSSSAEQHRIMAAELAQAKMAATTAATDTEQRMAIMRETQQELQQKHEVEMAELRATVLKLQEEHAEQTKVLENERALARAATQAATTSATTSATKATQHEAVEQQRQEEICKLEDLLEQALSSKAEALAKCVQLETAVSTAAQDETGEKMKTALAKTKSTHTNTCAHVQARTRNKPKLTQLTSATSKTHCKQNTSQSRKN